MKHIDAERIGKMWGEIAIQCGPIMTAFDGNQWGCPWMQYWNELHRGELPTSGILLMQDWGSENENLQTATSELKGWFGDSSNADKTIQHVLESTKWREAFENGEWLITNAVWGLRQKSEKCGYLGDCIHKRAYEVIWKELVVAAARAASNPVFRLVVAGEWSWFKGDPREMLLAEYLNKWDNFSNLTPSTEPILGQVLHCSHPSMWRWNGFKNGPPIFSENA
jgi:hypothetical protein